MVAGRPSSRRTSSSQWLDLENRARWRPTTTRREVREGLGLGCVHEPSEAPSSVGVPEAGLVELLQRQAAVLVAQRVLDDPGHRLGDQHRIVAGEELDAHPRTRSVERSARGCSGNAIAGRMIRRPARGRGKGIRQPVILVAMGL